MLALWLLCAMPLLAFVTTRFSAARLIQSSARWQLLDHPNARSLHQRPVPRTGGLAVLAGILLGNTGLAVLLPDTRAFLAPVLYGLLPLVLISWLDDRKSIAARWRFSVHVMAATSLILAFLTHNPSYPTAIVISPLILASEGVFGLFIVWMINLYNFMDGMDGFAGGMAAIGFTALAWLGRADLGFAVSNLVIAAASLGFLAYNFPPAKLFLGDTGSTALGFLAAAGSLWGHQAGLFPFWAALWVFSPFIVDATVTLLRRLLRGERVWEAHRSHYYQRLVLLGWGHRRTVLVEYALMLACAGSAVWAVSLSARSAFLLAIGIVAGYGLLMAGVHRLERRRSR